MSDILSLIVASGSKYSEMDNHDRFGTDLWQNLGAFVCNSKVPVPVETLQRAGHIVTQRMQNGCG